MSTTTIDIENSKQIRASMEVYCGLSAENPSASETVSGIDAQSDVALMDTNAASAVKASSWSAVPVTDLSGGGFALDEGAEFVDVPHVGSPTGKYGIQSFEGGDLSVKVYTNVSAVSITCLGSGTVTVNGVSYPLQNQLVVPVPELTTTELYFANSDSNGRIVIQTIVPGVVLSFNNDNLVSVTLDLAGDLSLTDPTFEASSIEINAYYPADISEIISSVAEDTPLWYYAGYPGDYCETRKFYLSEDAVQKDNVITLHGTDASGRLCERTTNSKLLHAGKTTGLGCYELYNYMKSIVTGAGIKLAHFQKMTNPGGSYSPGEYVVSVEQDVQTLFGSIMLELHEYPQEYAPTYIDAGIPTMYHKKTASGGTYKSPYQLRVWTINEEDCAEVERKVEKRINWVYNSENNMPLLVKITDGGEPSETIEKFEKCKKDGIYTADFDRYYHDISVSLAKKVYLETMTKVKWSVSQNGTSFVYGRPLTETQYLFSDAYSGLTPRAGVKVYVTPSFRGMFRRLWSSGYISYNEKRMNGSNITGSFTFKGDPRMQPRDTFKFVRLDGTTEIATIERIELTHEGGGTSATLYYRLGVM